MADRDKAARRVSIIETVFFSISDRADFVTHKFNNTYSVNWVIELSQSITVLKLNHLSFKPNRRFKPALSDTVVQ